MSVTVVRPEVTMCSSCYADLDGHTCGCHTDSSVNPNEVKSTVISMAPEGDQETTEMENATSPATENTNTATEQSNVTTTTPAVSAAQVAVESAIKAVASAQEEAVAEATGPLNAEIADLKSDLRLARRERNRLSDRLYSTERDLQTAAGLLVEGLHHTTRLAQDVAAQEDMLAADELVMTIAAATIADQTAENARLNKALKAAHAFARKAYSDPSTPRALKGEAAIAIVEISDAVTAR